MVPGVALLGSRLFLEAGGDVPHVLSSSCSGVPKPVLLIPCPSFHPNALLNPCGGWAPVLWVSVCLSMAGSVGAGSEGAVPGHADCPRPLCSPLARGAAGGCATVPAAARGRGDMGMWEQWPSCCAGARPGRGAGSRGTPVFLLLALWVGSLGMYSCIRGC